MRLHHDKHTKSSISKTSCSVVVDSTIAPTCAGALEPTEDELDRIRMGSQAFVASPEAPSRVQQQEQQQVAQKS